MADDLRHRYAEALDISVERCARCKTCDRQVDAVMAVRDEEVERLRAAALDKAGLRLLLEQAEQTLRKVRDLHFAYRGPGDFDSCAACSVGGHEVLWPCETIKLLDRERYGDAHLICLDCQHVYPCPQELLPQYAALIEERDVPETSPGVDGSCPRCHPALDPDEVAAHLESAVERRSEPLKADDLDAIRAELAEGGAGS